MKCLSILALVCGLFCFGNEAVDIERFGRQGDLTPQFMGQPMPESFFKSNRADTFSDGKNHVAYLEIPKERHYTAIRTKRGEQMQFDGVAEMPYMEIVVQNLVDLQTDLVVTATRFKENQVRNFLIQLQPDGYLRLDVSALAGFDALHVVSTFAFEANLSYENTKGGLNASYFNHTEPREDIILGTLEKSNDPCRETARVPKRLSGTGWSILAYFELTYSVFGRPSRDLQIYYPTNSTSDLFHETSSSAYSLSTCYMYYFLTRQVTTGVENTWIQMSEALIENSDNGIGCAGDHRGVPTACPSEDYIVGPLF